MSTPSPPILSSDLSKCLEKGNGGISVGAIVGTRIYNSNGKFISNGYCVSNDGTTNIPDGEMFYEIIKSNANINIVGFDQNDGKGNQIDLIANSVKSLTFTTLPPSDDSNYQLGPGAIAGIALGVIFLLILLSSGGYYGHRYYKKWSTKPSLEDSDFTTPPDDYEPHFNRRNLNEGMDGGYKTIRY
jgi:hypothetical protein